VSAVTLQSAFTYISIACAVLVFTAETYVQRNETTKALMALIESKKNYVRYISHEIRTPLSATVMGLRVLNDTLRLQNDIDDDIFDTLKDVQSSCTAALDILNDLLSFNKLESGKRLTRH
jgi:signal transduction histidine kinase